MQSKGDDRVGKLIYAKFCWRGGLILSGATMMTVPKSKTKKIDEKKTSSKKIDEWTMMTEKIYCEEDALEIAFGTASLDSHPGDESFLTVLNDFWIKMIQSVED
mmetsp:Transcript_23439/g.50786  ORF Transcript_23439/g.50786 Transcript_23439/m.50786 type:complete len:104 (+) Transcript_23439:2026-2337(+)